MAEYDVQSLMPCHWQGVFYIDYIPVVSGLNILFEKEARTDEMGLSAPSLFF
jgi:hypothetical protein